MVIPVPAVLPDSTLAPEQVLQKFSPTTLAGLGAPDYSFDCGDAVNTYDPATDSFYCANPTTVQPLTVAAQGPPPQGVNTDWASLIARLTSQGIDVAKLAIVQPGTVQTPGGISRQNPGYPVLTGPGGSPGASVGVGGTLGNMSNLLLIGGLGLMVVLVMSKNRG